MPSRFNAPFFSRAHLIAPGRRTVSLTRPRDAQAGYGVDTTWGIFSAQKRPVNQAAMRFFSGFGQEQFQGLFILPALSVPAEVRNQVAKNRGIDGWIITETDGTRWQIQSCRVNLLEQDYWAACNQLQAPNEVVQPTPPDPIGGEPDPDPPGDPPTATITAVAPDPRATTATSITIVFSKVVSGFVLADLSLKRDGGSDLLTGSQVVSTVDGITWTLSNLTGITATNGTYVLLLTASGSAIVDADDQALAGNASETWVVNSVLLTGAITPVTPDPKNSATSAITITFSAAVTGFTIADLSLKRNGGANLLTGSQTLTTSNDIAWSLGNLSSLTGTAGSYVLLLTASGSGIVDGSLNALASDVSESWTVDTTAPTCVITPVTMDPRTEPVEDILIVFSEAVISFSLADITLTRDGGANLIGAQTLTTFDNVTWTLGNLTGVTTATGTYLLTILAANVKDTAENQLAANATDTWVCVAPTVAQIPSTDERMEAGVYTTSIFIPAVPGPYPHRMSGIVISYNQATIAEAEVLTGLPGGVTKINQQLDHFAANSDGLPFLEISGSALLTPTILNAYRGLPASATSAGRYEGRGLFPVPGVMWNSAYTSRIRSDFGQQPTNLESYAYMDFNSASNRAFWSQKIIDHVSPYFQDPYRNGTTPKYQGLWIDEQADPLADPGVPAIVDHCTGFLGPIRNAIRAYGALLSINMSTSFQFSTAAADAIVDNLDILYVERMFTKSVVMTSTAFPICISRMRRMWDRNPTGFAILDQYGIDAQDNNRECVITAAANAPGGGMRITCSTPHYLANTAMKFVRIMSLTGFADSGYYTCTPVTDYVFDTVSSQFGTLTPTGSSKARFVHSDLEVGCALMMIAAQFAGRRKMVYYSPSYSPIEPYSWPAMYGVPSGDYVIDNVNGSGLITELHCNFTGGTLPASRVTVLPQTERTAYWEAL
jgi:hypothetical protein